MNRPSRIARIALAALLSAAPLAAPSSARAQNHAANASSAGAAAVEGEVFVVLASHGTGGIAPELRSLDGLRQAPFDSFGELRLLERAAVALAEGRPIEKQLPNGRTLRLELLGRTAQQRYRVRVSIQRAGSNDYLPLLTVVTAPGDPFFVAGQSFQGGTLVIGVRVGRG